MQIFFKDWEYITPITCLIFWLEWDSKNWGTRHNEYFLNETLPFLFFILHLCYVEWTDCEIKMWEQRRFGFYRRLELLIVEWFDRNILLWIRFSNRVLLYKITNWLRCFIRRKKHSRWNHVILTATAISHFIFHFNCLSFSLCISNSVRIRLVQISRDESNLKIWRLFHCRSYNSFKEHS